MSRTFCFKELVGKRSSVNISGYQCFLQAVLYKLKMRYPDDSVVLSEVNLICAEKWKNIEDFTKGRFQDEADAINRAKNNAEAKSRKRNSTRIQEIKFSFSPFMLFCKKNRQTIQMKYPQLTTRQVSAVLSSLWSKTESRTKKTYQQLSRMEHTRYGTKLKVSMKKT